MPIGCCGQLLRVEARRSIMSTAVLQGGYVREDIRLGNEALTRQDLDTARQYFQQVLVSDDATVMQNALRPIVSGRLPNSNNRQQSHAHAPRQNRGRVGKPPTPNSRRGPCASLCPSH